MLVAYIADHTQLLYNVPPTPVLATSGNYIYPIASSRACRPTYNLTPLKHYA